MSRYDILEEVEKFNLFHDRSGRFASANGAGASAPQRNYQDLTHEDAKALAKEMGQNVSDEDRRQIESHNSLTGGYLGTFNAFVINGKLRSGGDLNEDDQKTVDAMDRNMRKSTRDVNLTRKVDGGYMKALGLSDYDPKTGMTKEEMDKLVGKVTVDKGYTSTSFNMRDNVMKRKDITMNIKAPKGTKMMVSPKQDYDGNIAEAEIILGRNTALKITGVRETGISGSGNHKYEIDCEVISI